MERVVFVLGCALVLALGCGPAAQPTTTPTEPTVTPTTSADPVVEHFATLEGAFDVTGESTMPPAAPMPFAATGHQWLAEDGKTLMMTYVQPAVEGGSPGMDGWGKIWFDAVTSAVKMSWMDSMMPGHWMEATGTFQPDGSLQLEAQETGPDGQPMTFRMIYRFTEPEKYDFEMGAVGADGTFAPMMRYSAARTGAATETWTPPEAAPTPPPADTTTTTTTP